MNTSNFKPFVSVVIPAHNEEKYIGRTINSLIEQDYGLGNFEIIVIDNNSSDKTAEILSNYDNVRYYFKKEGPVGAVRNYGAKFTKGSVLAFIDGDCVADKSWLNKTIKLLYSSNNIGAVGGKYELDNNAAWIERYWLIGVKSTSLHKQDLLGGDTIIPKDVFYKIGQYDESITSGEDTKITEQLRENNYKVIIDQSLNVVHLGNAKSVKAFISRQIWHSENYLINIKKSLRDATFYLIIIFIALSAIATSNILTSPEISIIALLSTIPLALIFSIKRISRSPNKSWSVIEILTIAYIDYIYLIGRSIGTVKGIKILFQRIRTKHF